MRFIKKIFCIFVLAIILFIGSSFAESGKVNVSATRLREEKNTDSNILTNIYEGDKVNILSEEGDWYKVQYDGKTGYVKKEYISLDTKKEKNTTNTSTSMNTTNISNTNTSTNTSNSNTLNNNTIANNTTNTSNTNTIENYNTNTSNIAQNSENEEVVTINSVTSIRNIPNMISQSISTVEQSKQLKKLEEIGNWIKVTDGNITGWILKAKTITSQSEPINSSNFTNTTNANTVNNNATSENEIKKENSENTTTNTSINKTGTINVETANVRETANASANIIGFLDYNDKVNITDENGEWYKITSGNTSGYVNKKLITISDDNQISSRSLTEERKSVQEDTTVNQENSKSSNNTLDNTNTGKQVAEYAKQYLGCSYVVGGKTPTTGFDCSGFTRYIYLNFGYTLGNTASSQTNVGKEISRESLQIGDLILFYNEGKTSIGHTGIYLGNGDFIHAANPQRGVVIDNLNTNSYYNERFVSARRIVD